MNQPNHTLDPLAAVLGTVTATEARAVLAALDSWAENAATSTAEHTEEEFCTIRAGEALLERLNAARANLAEKGS